MSEVPAVIPGVGPTTAKLRVSPKFDAMKAGIGPEEYFVLSRMDGNSQIREVLQMTGFSIPRGIEIIQKLRSLGALLLPSEAAPAVAPPTVSRTKSVQHAPVVSRTTTSTGPTVSRTTTSTTNVPPAIARTATPQPAVARTATPQPVVARVATPVAAPVVSRTATPAPSAAPTVSRTATPPPAAPVVSRTASGPLRPMAMPQRPPTRDLATKAAAATKAVDDEWALNDPSHDELRAMVEEIELSDLERRRILVMARRIAAGDPWKVFGLAVGTDNREIKRAYFRMSKDFHPDRYYTRKCGSFAGRLQSIFEVMSRAYSEMTAGKVKSSSGPGADGTVEAQTPAEYGNELFTRACDLEIHGDALEAMKLFAAAIRIDGQVKYLRRAARCALAAGQPRSSEEYANKVLVLEPGDPSVSRILAAAFRAQGKLEAAEEVLVMAMAVPIENDSLSIDLRRELAEIRKLSAAAAAENR